MVVGVGAVGTGYSADVLGGEGVAELVGLPELSGNLGRGDELVPRGSLAPGTLVLGIVLRQVRAATAIVLPCSP